jgi:sugar porter (SP) family MFS transporter
MNPGTKAQSIGPAHPIRGAVIGGAVVASLGSLLFGFDTVVISGTTDALQNVFHLDSFWLGFTVAIALIGTIVGSSIVGKPADAFGRKNVLFALAICYFVSAAGCGLAQNWWEFLVARFIGGLAIGGTSVVTPMYIAEISPPHLRGRLVMINQLNIVLGILLCCVSNYLVARYFPFEVAWRWMLGVLAFPSIILFFLIFSILESPRSLVKRGRLADAKRNLERLGEEDADTALAAIQASLADEPGHAQQRLFRRAYSRPILLACTVAFFNQLTGINAMLYYAPKIFSMAGASRASSLVQSVAVGGTLFIFTIVAMFIIDRLGRRILLLIGSVGMTVCLTLVGGAFSIGSGGSMASGRLLLVALIGSIGFFAISQGAVMFVFISEVFPNAIRAKGQAFGTFVHWSMAAIVTWTFPVVAERFVAGTFGFFALMMVLQLLFVWKIMPETKGGALEDIGKRLSG